MERRTRVIRSLLAGLTLFSVIALSACGTLEVGVEDDPDREGTRSVSLTEPALSI